MPKTYNRTIKIEEQYRVKVLDQQLKFDSVDEMLLTKFGGCTVFDDYVGYNYREYGSLNIFDNNDILLLLPSEVTDERLDEILDAVEIVFHKEPLYTELNGAWIGENGLSMEKNKAVYIRNVNITALRLGFIISLMRDIRYEYYQEATAIYINDSLILI